MMAMMVIILRMQWNRKRMIDGMTELIKEEKESHFEIMNAEEDPTATRSGTMDSTFGDLQQFADGLDLENVEVDSDTEQNFEMLLEQLDDEPATQNKNQNETEKEK